MSDAYTYKVDRDKDSGIKVEVTVTPERIKETETRVYQELAKDVEIKGFRPGKAPESDIKAKLGPKLLNETLNAVLPELAADIVEQEELNPITQLEYTFEEIDQDGNVKFSFTFTNYPNIELGDFSKLKVEKLEIKIEKEEIQEVIQRLFKQQAEDAEQHDHDAKPDESDEEQAEIEEKEIEVTDEKVKELGLEGIETISDLEKQIEERIRTVKGNDQNRIYQDQVIEAAIATSNIKVPAALLQQQADSLVADHIAQVEQLGVDVDSFLEAQGTTRKELEEQKLKQAEKQISAELLLSEIAKQHTILPTAEDVESEIEGITDADARQNFDSPQGRRHILSILIQQRGLQKLMQFVEGNGKVEEKQEKQDEKKEKKSKQKSSKSKQKE